MYYGNPLVGPQENPEAVWSSGFKAVWHLAEDAVGGGTHYDSTSSSYDGIQSGNAQAGGRVAFGQYFDGTNDWIRTESTEGFDPVGDLTISGWFRIPYTHDSTTATSRLIMEKYLNNDDDMHIGLVGLDYASSAPAGTLVFKVENSYLGGSSARYVYTSTNSWAQNTWYYFSCRMDSASSANNRIYINGIEDYGGIYGSNDYNNLTFSANWGIGGRYVDSQFPGGEGWFNGYLDEVRVASGLRSSQWLRTEYFSQSSGSFYTVGTESERLVYQPSFTKLLDATAPAGLWTASVHYRDVGATVDFRAGEYERNFIVQHATSLSLVTPGLQARIAGELLYMEVSLTDTVTSNPVTGATVSANWSVSGIPTNVNLEDYGDGRYGKTVDTVDLVDTGRWKINIQSSHPYYKDASTNFDVDITHNTELAYELVTTTPIGFDFKATLVYRDAFDGTTIDGATITFGDGSPVSYVAEGNGKYAITIPSTGLSAGDYTYTFNATPATTDLEMASTSITFNLRPHNTSVTISGDLAIPWGEDTPVTVLLTDMDTGATVPYSAVSTFSFMSLSHGSVFYTGSGYDITLDTDSWATSDTLTVSVSMSDPDYYAPDDYDFDITIRAHYTSATVVGDLVTPYGNNTPLTVVLTDLDTASVISNISLVDTFTFTSFYGSQPVTATSFDATLNTNSWSVGSTVVTLSVTMASSAYQTPTDYDFQVIISSLTTYMYHEPSTLRFSTGQDFLVTLRINVSEPGPNYGLPVAGLSEGEFSVPGYTVAVDTSDQTEGRYNLTISGSSFLDGYHTITVYVNPLSANYSGANLVVTFLYEPGIAALSSPNYPQITTPFDTDVQITLNYEDADSGAPIAGATIGGNITTYGQAGTYTIWISVTGFAKGSHRITLWADHGQYQNKSLTFTLVIRDAFTYALPSVGALDIPLGNDPVFTVDYHDLDNDVSVLGATVGSSWANFSVTYLSGPGLYEITFITLDSDSLVQSMIVSFTFSRPNHQNGTFSISVTIRQHTTDFRLVSAVEPTSYTGTIEIPVYYGDVDNAEGIGPLSSIGISVENVSGSVTVLETLEDGGGYYTIRIEANRFGLGLQTFNITFSWSGLEYQTKWLVATANVVGVDSRLTLMEASEPASYGDSMSYIFFYSDLGGTGIDNVTAGGGGNVHIYVSFQGEPVDLAQVTIAEIDAATQAGNYSISFNTTILDHTGLIYMNVYINWTAGAAPFYTNRFDIISVRVLPRDTLVSITPPTPTYYGETGWFTFSYDDVTGGGNVPIEDDPALDISLSITHSVNYISAQKIFNVTFDTSQFLQPLGTKTFTLDVTWGGAPFYANRTGRVVSILLLAHLTVLDFQSPAPTPFLDNVTFSVTWTDFTGGSAGISGAALTLYDGATPIGLSFYSVIDHLTGQYEIELNTTYYSSPGSYLLRVELTTSEFYILDAADQRTFNVRQRPTLVSVEPTGAFPYFSTMDFVVNYQDLLTLAVVGNGSGLVSFDILNGSSWLHSISWNAAFQHYELSVVTSNQPTLAIGTRYVLEIRMSYASQAPYYGQDTTLMEFELRSRASELVLVDSPDPAAYLNLATFTVFYKDTDAAGSVGIVADSVTVYLGATPLTLSTNNLGGGYYEISVNTTVIGAPGLYALTVEATYPTAIPYHDDAQTDVNVAVTNRETYVELLAPPLQTPYLDMVTFRFAFVDVGHGTRITGITESELDVWGDGAPINPADFILTQIGDYYEFEVNSSDLTAILVSNYNLTIRIDVNNLVAPYYWDATSRVRVTVTERFMTYSPEPIDSVSFGGTLSIRFNLSDATRDWPVTGVDIIFDGQTVPLTEGVDFSITPGTGVDAGRYTIDVNTTALGSPGDAYFNLDVSWPGGAPYYAALPTIVVTGYVQDIETSLTAYDPVIQGPWKGSAFVQVNFTSIYDGSGITGASVIWIWPAANGSTGIMSDPLATGTYEGFIPIPAAIDAGTYLITIEANKVDYRLAQTFVTLVVSALPSTLQIVSPTGSYVEIDKGSSIPVAVYLSEGGSPIDDQYLVAVSVTLEGMQYPLAFNGTNGYYEGLLPGSATEVLDVGVAYSVRFTAQLRNYEPATGQFTIGVIESRSELAFIGMTSDEMLATFTETVVYTINLSAPDLPPYPLLLPGAEVKWFIAEAGASGNFTDLGGGIYSADVNTTEIGYGIWGLTIRANPAEPDIASTKIQGILTITRIRTNVVVPPEVSEVVYWGWYGFLDFQYWDESFGAGIDDANVTVSFPGAAPELNPLGNGWYRVNIDTRLLPAAENVVSKYALELSFSKPSYQEAREIVYVNLKEVPMEIVVESVEYTPDYVGPLDSVTDLRIPIGDLVNITMLFNDTDYSEFIVGGLEGAIATPNSFLRGPTIDSYLNVTFHELGEGYYDLIFDTRDPEIAAAVSDVPFSLFLEMYLGNHTRRQILFRIQVIETTTELVLQNTLPDTLINGQSVVLEVFYNDTWHGVGIPGATLNASTAPPQLAHLTVEEAAATPGLYLVTVSPEGIWNSGSGFIVISADLGTFLGATLDNVRLTVIWNDFDHLTMNLTRYGLPLALVAILILIGYVRIWSVPKRLRQINGQIKTIRKGRIPDPIKEVKSRQDIVADLFNDTFEETGIKRVAYQMPEESVEIEVPEMGELLMQLAILTNLSAEELDEFKADIVKMRVSEQATFVKEVIDQEAVRASRREGKSVDEVIDEVSAQARRRLKDLEEPEEQIPAPIVKPVKEPTEEVERMVDTEEPSVEGPAPEEEEIPERLSAFELDELKAELMKKGVPTHEIDVIIEQAKKLPREMVEELIKSVGKSE